MRRCLKERLKVEKTKKATLVTLLIQIYKTGGPESKMKILYLDCFSGISGDMFLGAMLDLGLDRKDFLDELQKLNLSDYNIDIKKSINKGISGTDVYIETTEQHPHRGLTEIYKIIDESLLKDKVKRKSKDAFLKLAKAEAKVHGTTPDKIHFHEVGAVDSIIDIVGACILMDMLDVKKVISSKVNVGHGVVKCAHGVLPVPAPATLELLKNIPVYSQGEEGELVTPTGALLLSTFVDSFTKIPSGKVKKVGYGLAKTERSSPNVLRAIIIDDDSKAKELETDEVFVLEANIDDMNPEFYENVLKDLLVEGALDAFLEFIVMKKSRPGVKLTCISPEDKKEKLIEIILKETTTIGVREYKVSRTKLSRSTKILKTKHGNVRVKVSKKGDKVVRITPEYEDLKKIAMAYDLPILEIYREILIEIENRR